MTVKAAREKLFQATQIFDLRCERAVLNASISSMRPKIVEAAFVERCCAATVEKQTGIQDFSSRLGITIRGTGVAGARTLSQEKAMELYDKTMTAIYEEEAAETRREAVDAERHRSNLASEGIRNRPALAS